LRHVEEPNAEDEATRFRSRPQQEAFIKQALKQPSGQAAIEFIVCILVIFFFLFFYLSLAILIVTSEYIDYATFMAARTLRSGYRSRQGAEANARIVFDKYTQRIQGIARNFKLDLVGSDDPDRAGVISTYDMDLFYLPPIFMGSQTPPSRVTLQSESHLGREPGHEECFQFFRSFVRRLNIPNGEAFVEEMEDNGC